MPELPDLEVFKRYVDSTSLHQNIETIEVKDGRVLGGVSAGDLSVVSKARNSSLRGVTASTCSWDWTTDHGCCCTSG